MTLPAPGDILDYIEFVIHFKTNSANGLLFYWNDEKKHLAVYLQNGYVNVLINMGTDAAILRSEQPISLQTWQKAEVWRSGKGILLKVKSSFFIIGFSFRYNESYNVVLLTFLLCCSITVLIVWFCTTAFQK